MQSCSFKQILRTTALAAWVALALAGCGALSTPVRSVVYDFGPGATQTLPSNRMAPLPPLVLAEVDAPVALESTAILYRLLYADAQQLRPYAQARWSMPPAQLLRQRVREQLGARRQVLGTADANPASGAALQLRLELEEFSHLFDAPQSSGALVRVRATLSQNTPGARMLAQHSFVVRHPSASADAAGGVKALAQASDALIAQLDAWLQQAGGAAGSP